MVQKSGGSPPGILIKTCKYWDDEQPIKLNWGYPPEIVLVDTKDNGLEHVPSNMAILGIYVRVLGGSFQDFC